MPSSNKGTRLGPRLWPDSHALQPFLKLWVIFATTCAFATCKFADFFKCLKTRRKEVCEFRPMAWITLTCVISAAAPKAIWMHMGKNSWGHLAVPSIDQGGVKFLGSVLQTCSPQFAMDSLQKSGEMPQEHSSRAVEVPFIDVLILKS